ncbi:hypothetical protein Y032_0693g1587 [Ancylostoma ceylanicum]|uniref:Uncharacterized protein n=1 Tax=Ancylostoma ceylanicum TaxID=53326 RepID=A0A016WHN7_9BILA|nr:hypothetical protein Y032_0693g1587 [Ancylostoma ceylanicum]
MPAQTIEEERKHTNIGLLQRQGRQDATFRHHPPSSEGQGQHRSPQSYESNENNMNTTRNFDRNNNTVKYYQLCSELHGQRSGEIHTSHTFCCSMDSLYL